MKSYLPYKLQSLINWMRNNKISPMILVDKQSGYINISAEQSSNNNMLMIDLSSPSISDFVVTTEGIKFNLLINNETKLCFASIDAVVSVISKEDGVGYVVAGLAQSSIHSAYCPTEASNVLH